MENVDLKKIKEFLEGRLDNSYANLETAEEDELKWLFEEEIKDLKAWLKELEKSNLVRIKEGNGFLEWKINFLKNEIRVLKDILENDDTLTKDDVAEIKRQEDLIKTYIGELKRRKRRK